MSEITKSWNGENPWIPYTCWSDEYYFNLDKCNGAEVDGDAWLGFTHTKKKKWKKQQWEITRTTTADQHFSNVPLWRTPKKTKHGVVVVVLALFSIFQYTVLITILKCTFTTEREGEKIIIHFRILCTKLRYHVHMSDSTTEW